MASIAQLAEHALRKRTVVGSIPTGGFFHTLFRFTSSGFNPETQPFLEQLPIFRHGQFARVVKGVDLRSTAGNCAWVRTPQLTIFLCISFSLSFFLLSSSVSLWGNPYFSPSLPFSSPPISLSSDLKLETLRNMVCAKKLEHLTVADFLRCCISWVKSDMIEELALTLILTLIPNSNILRLIFQ